MARDQRFEGLLAAVGRVDIEDDEAAGVSGGQTEIRIGPPRPPGPDHCLVDARIPDPMRGARVLAGGTVAVPAAGTPAFADAVERQHGPALPRVVKRGLQERLGEPVGAHRVDPEGRGRETGRTRRRA